MRTIKRSMFLLILLSMTAPAVTLLSPTVSAATASEEAQLLHMINQDRTSRNIPALNLHPLLVQVAKNYSREMMEHGFLSHVSQVDGSTLWDRIKRSGYYDGYHGQIAIRENIALVSGPARATAAHQGFMNSEGHRENLLASDVNEGGIGITEGTFQSVFSAIYVEVFAYHARDQKITLFASVNPITATVRRGETASFTIHVESSVLTTISIEVANLRHPLVWNLASSSGTTPLDTTLTVDTASASVGVYPFDVVVRGAGQTKTLSATLNVVMPTQTTTARTTTATSFSISVTSSTVTASTIITQTATVATRTTETLSSTQSMDTVTTQTVSSTSTGISITASTASQATTESTTYPPTQTVSTSTTRSSTWRLPPLRCVIATAAFGSKLSPEVQYLRQFRDEKIMSSFSGRMFMSAFNAAYYSFSPRIAAFVAEYARAAVAVREVIYPLIAVLRSSSLVLNRLSVDGEIAVLLCGLLASSLIGLIYFFPLAAILDLRREAEEQ